MVHTVGGMVKMSVARCSERVRIEVTYWKNRKETVNKRVVK